MNAISSVTEAPALSIGHSEQTEGLERYRQRVLRNVNRRAQHMCMTLVPITETSQAA